MDGETLIDVNIPPQEELIPTLQTNPDPLVKEEIATPRAEKYHFGLGKASPGQQQLKYDIQSAKDSLIRERAVMEDHVQETELRRTRLQQWIQHKSSQGEQVTPEEAETIQKLTRPELQDPKLILEKLYAKKVVEKVAGPMVDAAMAQDPEKASMLIQGAEKTIALKEYAQKLLETKQAEWENSTRYVLEGGNAPGAEVGRSKYKFYGNHLEQLIPFKSWYSMQNAIGPANSFLLGDNLADQAADYYSLPAEAATKRLDAAVEEMWRRNPLDAIAFLEAMVSQTKGDRIFGNLVSLADLSIVGEIAWKAGSYGLRKAGVTAAIKERIPSVRSILPEVSPAAIPGAAHKPPRVWDAITKLDNSLKDAVQANSNPFMTQAELAAASGNIPESANLLATETLTKRANRAGQPETFDDIKAQTMPLFNPGQTLDRTPGTQLSREQALLLRENMEKRSETLVNKVFNQPYDIDRLKPGTPAFDVALAEANKALVSQHPNVGPRVLNVKFADPPPPSTPTKLAQKQDAVHSQIQREGKTKAYHDFSVANQELKNATDAIAKVLGDKELTKARRALNTRAQFMGYGDLNVKINKAFDRTKNPKKLAAAQALRADFDRALSKVAANSPDDIKLFQAADRLNKRANIQAMPGPVASGAPGDNYVKGLGNVYYARYEIGQAGKKELSGAPGIAEGMEINPRKNASIGGKDIANDQRPENFPANQEIQPLGYRNKFYFGADEFGKPAGPVSHKMVSANDNFVFEIGDGAAGLFASQFQAAYEMTLMGLRGEVKQRGNGWYIEVLKPIDETNPNVRAQLQLDLKATPTPKPGILTSLIDSIPLLSQRATRGRDFLLHRDMQKDLATATYGATAVLNAFKEVMKPVSKLSRQDMKGLKKYLDYERNFDNGAGEAAGKFASDQVELEQLWKRQQGSYPTYEQSNAYWTIRQVYDADYVSRNLGIYTPKVRAGTEQFWWNGLPDTAGVEGKLLDKFPHGRRGNVSVVKWGDKGDHEVLGSIYQRAEIDALVEKGYKVVQLSQYGSDALRASTKDIPGNGKITYALVKNPESSPIPYQQIPYKPGIHHRYEAPYMLRSPKMEKGADGVWMYSGDSNVHSFSYAPMGKTMEKHYNKALEIYRGFDTGLNTKDDLDNYVLKNLPHSPDEFRSMIYQGILNPEHGVVLARDMESADKAMRLRHKMGDKFLDLRDSDHNLWKGAVELDYALERGETLTSVAQRGTKENPYYQRVAAPMMDALPTVERAISDLARGRHLNDLKMKSAEQFVQEFGHLIDVDINKLQENPFRYLFAENVPWRSMSETNAAEYHAARGYLRSMREFMGVKNQAQNGIDSVLQKVYDTTAAAFGEKPAALVQSIAEIPALRHPAQTLKNLVFKARMSSPTQLALQYQQMLSVVAIEGWEASLKASGAFKYAYALRWNDSPAHLDHYAKQLASHGGWTADQFKEAWQAGQSSGFLKVFKESGDMGRFMDPGIVQGKFGNATDMLLTFFKEGELGPRNMAWFAAYYKWRKANPLATFDDRAVAQVLKRADDTTNNMSSASISSLQQAGDTGLLTQFWGYQMRLFESMTGFKNGKWTKQERGRLAATWSLMYGLPATTGAVTVGFAGHELIREMSLGMGYDPNNNVVTRILTQGLANEALMWANGGESTNFGERMGPGGFSFARDVVSGNKEMIDLFAGPKFVKDIFKSAAPFVRATVDAFGGPEYPLVKQDFLTALSNISMADSGIKAYYAVAYGEYISKQGKVVGRDADKGDAVLQFLFGTTPEKYNYAYTMSSILKHEKEVKQEAELKIKDYMHAMIRAAADDNDSLARDYATRISTHFTLARFTNAERHHVIQRALKGNETLFERVNKQWAMSRPDRLEQYYLQGK